MTGFVDRHIQTISWVVLLLAFATFVVLLFGVPWSGYHYLKTATAEETAEAECKVGSCSLAVAGSELVVRPEDGAITVREGNVFATDQDSQGLIRFVDGSTANLEHNTAVALVRLRRPRFEVSEDVRRVEFRLEPTTRGTNANVRMGTTWEDTDYAAVTDLGRVRVMPESRARAELDASRMHVRVDEGAVEVESQGEVVVVHRDERTEVRVGSPPDEPREALENVIVGGSFDKPLDQVGWVYRAHIPGVPDDSGQDQPIWGERRVLEDDRSVLHIERTNSQNRPADVIFEKQLGELDVSGVAMIEVRGQVRVLDQSLPLGGERGTELPLILKLVYETENGEQYGWSTGFYTTEPGPDDPPDKYVLSSEYVNVKVPRGEWYSFSSGNLLDSQHPGSFESFGWPRPKNLLRLEIIASGHDYVSEVDDIAIWVK